MILFGLMDESSVYHVHMCTSIWEQTQSKAACIAVPVELTEFEVGSSCSSVVALFLQGSTLLLHERKQVAVLQGKRPLRWQVYLHIQNCQKV